MYVYTQSQNIAKSNNSKGYKLIANVGYGDLGLTENNFSFTYNYIMEELKIYLIDHVISVAKHCLLGG